MTESLKDLLGDALERHNLSERYTAAAILKTCGELIKEHTEPKVAKEILPTTYRHGVVFLSVEHHAAAQEFRFSEEKILQELQRKHPDSDIRRFTFLLGSKRDREEVA